MRIGKLYELPTYALKEIISSHEKALNDLRLAGKMPTFFMREYTDVIISQAKAIINDRSLVI